MTEPPRPPGDGDQAPPPPPSYPAPGEASYAPPPSGGYGPPPGGGYPGAPGGYPPGPGGAPVGFANNEDKTWALVAHFGGAAGMFIGAGCAGWIAPLVALLARGNQSPAVRAHAVSALNFQILWSIIGVIGWVLACILIGFLLVFAAVAMGVILGVIAGIKANEGQLYKYPASINMIK